MNKKFKYTSVVAAGLVTLGLVGGTLAYFTSSDTVTNKFLTGQTDKPNKPNSGVEIGEEFIQGSQLLPGLAVNKDVQVHNTANYPQFIKVNFDVKFYKTTTEGRQEVTKVTIGNKEIALDPSMVKLNMTNLETSAQDQKWLAVGTAEEGQQSWEYSTYYYIGKVAPKGTKVDGKLIDYTSILLDSVTLDPSAGDAYKNLEIDVQVNADSIQAAARAYAATSGWNNAATNSAYERLEDLAANKYTAPLGDKLPEVQ